MLKKIDGYASNFVVRFYFFRDGKRNDPESHVKKRLGTSQQQSSRGPSSPDVTKLSPSPSPSHSSSHSPSHSPRGRHSSPPPPSQATSQATLIASSQPLTSFKDALLSCSEEGASVSKQNPLHVVCTTLSTSVQSHSHICNPVLQDRSTYSRNLTCPLSPGEGMQKSVCSLEIISMWHRSGVVIPIDINRGYFSSVEVWKKKEVQRPFQRFLWVYVICHSV